VLKRKFSHPSFSPTRMYCSSAQIQSTITFRLSSGSARSRVRSRRAAPRAAAARARPAAAAAPAPLATAGTKPSRRDDRARRGSAVGTYRPTPANQHSLNRICPSSSRLFFHLGMQPRGLFSLPVLLILRRLFDGRRGQVSASVAALAGARRPSGGWRRCAVEEFGAIPGDGQDDSVAIGAALARCDEVILPGPGM
jgi:hypothetical protein